MKDAKLLAGLQKALGAKCPTNLDLSRIKEAMSTASMKEKDFIRLCARYVKENGVKPKDVSGTEWKAVIGLLSNPMTAE